MNTKTYVNGIRPPNVVFLDGAETWARNDSTQLLAMLIENDLKLRMGLILPSQTKYGDEIKSQT